MDGLIIDLLCGVPATAPLIGKPALAAQPASRDAGSAELLRQNRPILEQVAA